MRESLPLNELLLPIGIGKSHCGYNDLDAEEVVKAAYKLDKALKARGKN